MDGERGRVSEREGRRGTGGRKCYNLCWRVSKHGTDRMSELEREKGVERGRGEGREGGEGRERE